MISLVLTFLIIIIFFQKMFHLKDIIVLVASIRHCVDEWVKPSNAEATFA